MRGRRGEGRGERRGGDVALPGIEVQGGEVGGPLLSYTVLGGDTVRETLTLTLTGRGGGERGKCEIRQR